MSIALSLTKYKKALIFLLFAVIILITPQITFAATLTLNPAIGTANRGCNFSVNVDMNAQGAQTDGTDAIIKYDPTRFTATTITNGSIYPDYPGNSIDPQTGTINISGLASPETAFSSQGTLATINFVVAQNAPTGATTLTFKFDPNNRQNTTDSNVVERGTIVDLLNSVTNGTYTIGTGVCGSTTSVTTTGTGTGTSTTLTGTGTGTGIGGKGGLITDSSTSGVPLKELPQGAITGPTFILMAVGGLLTILGILGLALL